MRPLVLLRLLLASSILRCMFFQLLLYLILPSTLNCIRCSTDPSLTSSSIFLYLFLLAAFVGTLYFVYVTWIETLFPQLKRGGKGGERAKRSSAGTKKAIDPKDQVSVIGADGPAVTSGSLAQKAYDESWIPEGHLNRPSARRVQSGKSGKKVKVVQE
jgi:hypothetical protein